MRSNDDYEAQADLQVVLDRIAPNRFRSAIRKSEGSSAIGKPVDLEIRFSAPPNRVVVAAELANVNVTQLVGETVRLYFDTCPRKLLILGQRNTPADGKKQCEVLLARLYGQDLIEHTPARVAEADDDTQIEQALRDLLLID